MFAQRSNNMAFSIDLQSKKEILYPIENFMGSLERCLSEIIISAANFECKILIIV